MSARHTEPARTGQRLLDDAFLSGDGTACRDEARSQRAGRRRASIVRCPPVMRRRTRLAAWSLLILVAVPLAAQTGGDGDVLACIRDEANARSQILRSVHFLADVYGPRLTGSPNLKAAGEWAVAT